MNGRFRAMTSPMRQTGTGASMRVGDFENGNRHS
jgi:hypothetical protein